mgnify:CR=1 FL=1
MLLIGSHVNYNSKTQLLGALRQALSMNETTFMFYTGAPQNTMRSKVDSKLVEESLKELQENNIDINKINCTIVLKHPLNGLIFSFLYKSIIS